MNKERQICSNNNISDGAPYKWVHPDAKCIDSYDSWEEGESYDEYKCPHCNIVFKVYVTK